MADPLSISAGIVGIVVPAVHVARLLIDDVKSIIDAPEAIQRLRADLDLVVLALESLNNIEKSEWDVLGDAIAEQLKAAVSTCGSACNTFRNDLQRWTRRSRKGELSWRDQASIGFFKKQQIEAMSKHLQSCKLTFCSVVGMGTLYAVRRSNHMSEEIHNKIVASRTDLSNAKRQTDTELSIVEASIDSLSLDDRTPSSESEEDDKNGAEAQLSEQRVALEVCSNVLLELQSKLQEKELERGVAGASHTANVSFGSITNGFGIGVSNAPIGNITFGQSSETR